MKKSNIYGVPSRTSRRKTRRNMHDFHTFMLEGGLSDLGYEGPIFTWSNNHARRRRIWQRLDRFLGNGEAIASLPTLKVKCLIRFSSDHLPLLLTMQEPMPHRSRFIFQRIGTNQEDFKGTVADVWQENIHGSPSFRFVEKLCRLRKKLKAWNWNVFGSVQNIISVL